MKHIVLTDKDWEELTGILLGLKVQREMYREGDPVLNSLISAVRDAPDFDPRQNWVVEEEDGRVTITILRTDGTEALKHVCRTTQEKAEAEYLRAGIEKFLLEFDVNEDPESLTYLLDTGLRRLLREVDAEDSVQHLEEMRGLKELAITGWRSAKALAIAHLHTKTEERADEALKELEQNAAIQKDHNDDEDRGSQAPRSG